MHGFSEDHIVSKNNSSASLSVLLSVKRRYCTAPKVQNQDHSIFAKQLYDLSHNGQTVFI